MRGRADEGTGDGRYYLRFAATASLLVAGTLVLVLFVLPQRYVLESGFVESGRSFPDPLTPFGSAPAVRVAARELPAPPPEPLPGPGELFWDAVLPLLEEGRRANAAELMESYLRSSPEDRGARREYAVTLVALDRPEDAVEQLRTLLLAGDDFELRLTLARTLRELGRLDEASAEYRTLMLSRPSDENLALEWAQAHAWAGDFETAAAILRNALACNPDSPFLRVELSRSYYALDRLDDALDALGYLDEEALAVADGHWLRRDLVAALAVPAEEPVRPSLLDQAVAARTDGDQVRARRLFRAALGARPDDPEIWQAYADFLEYEVGDFDGAHTALLEVDRLGAADTDTQLRLAQLDIWAGRNPAARSRLEGLLALLVADPDADAATRAEVYAMLGDLDRWEGHRVAAAHHYEASLAADATNARAEEGLDAVRAETARAIVASERPRTGAVSLAQADTDEYSRVDLGGEWVEVADRWTWGGQVGNRWLGGVGLQGETGERQGVFFDAEGARWWRWGTVRTAVRGGAERVRRDAWEGSVGASVLHRAASGAATELALDHGPAYPVTSTLQSVDAAVRQERVALTHSRALGERWSLAATAEGAWLAPNTDGTLGVTSDGTARLLGALTLGRAMSETLTLGATARSVGFTDPAPVTVTGTTTIPRRLFWDPRYAVSVGPFARLQRDLTSTWSVDGTLGSGVALIDERGPTGRDIVPHLSAEAGLRHEGPRFSSALELFFSQGRFDGYRHYGARITFSARDLGDLPELP